MDYVYNTGYNSWNKLLQVIDTGWTKLSPPPPSPLDKNWNGFAKATDVYLFVGIKGTGKTTAIQKIFNLNDEAVQNDEGAGFTLWKLQRSSNISNKEVIVLECPGLQHSTSFTENARILLAIFNILQGLKIVEPKLIFFTANIADNRFDSHFSEFTQAMNTFRFLDNILTTSNWENAALVLTHGDQPAAARLARVRAEKYKETFRKVFRLIPQLIVLDHDRLNSGEISDFILNRKWKCLASHQHKIEEFVPNDRIVEDLAFCIRNGTKPIFLKEKLNLLSRGKNNLVGSRQNHLQGIDENLDFIEPTNEQKKQDESNKKRCEDCNMLFEMGRNSLRMSFEPNNNNQVDFYSERKSELIGAENCSSRLKNVD